VRGGKIFTASGKRLRRCLCR